MNGRASRPLEKSKFKGTVWLRAICHFLICFIVGFFIGLTPFVSIDSSINLESEHWAFSVEVIPPAPFIDGQTLNTSGKLELNLTKKIISGNSNDTLLSSSIQSSSSGIRKLLIIITPTYARPFQAYYMTRLGQTLKLVQPPLLWIVVEMNSQADETADILRKSGVMYRHLACTKNLTNIKDNNVHQRNVALSHIEKHRLDGVVYFADDNNAFSVDLFDQIRVIRRFGTWTVAKLSESKSNFVPEGPVCDKGKVIGWHTNRTAKTIPRFFSELSGFAFNSTVLWNPPKGWHRRSFEPIRQLDTVNKDFLVSMFIEQIIEDERQMEGLLEDCSRIRVWDLHLESFYSFYPQGWFMNNLNVAKLLA